MRGRAQGEKRKVRGRFEEGSRKGAVADLLLELSERVDELLLAPQLRHLAVALDHQIVEELVHPLEGRRRVQRHPLRLLLRLLLLLLLAGLRLLHVEQRVLVLLLGLRHRLLVDQPVVEVLNVLEVRQHVPTVLVLLAERVAHEVDGLQLAELAEVHDVVQLRDEVVAHGEDLQLLELVEALQLRDAVGEEREGGEVGQGVEAGDVGDVVEREVERLEGLEVAQVLDLLNDVVVQLQLHELVEAHEVVDLQHVLIRQQQALDLAEGEDLLLGDVLALLRRPRAQRRDALPAGTEEEHAWR